MAVCIMKQIVIADALLEIDKVRKLCLEKSVPDKKWQNLLLFTSRYISDTVKYLALHLIYNTCTSNMVYTEVMAIYE